MDRRDVRIRSFVHPIRPSNWTTMMFGDHEDGGSNRMLYLPSCRDVEAACFSVGPRLVARMHPDGTIDVHPMRLIRGGAGHALGRRESVDGGIGSYRWMLLCPSTTTVVHVVPLSIHGDLRRPRLQQWSVVAFLREQTPIPILFFWWPSCGCSGWLAWSGSSTTIPSISFPWISISSSPLRIGATSERCPVDQTCLSAGPRVVLVARRSHVATYARERRTRNAKEEQDGT